MDWDNFLDKELRISPRALLPPEVGFVCGADAAQFPGFQLLFASLVRTHRNVQVFLHDLGLTPGQRSWLTTQPAIQIGQRVHWPIPRTTWFWQKWIRPWLIRLSPFRYTIWLD